MTICTCRHCSVLPGGQSHRAVAAMAVAAGAQATAYATTGNEATARALSPSESQTSIAVAVATSPAPDGRMERIREARAKGYEGDACGECGNMTLVRNGTCMKCDTCGSTTGCS